MRHTVFYAVALVVAYPCAASAQSSSRFGTNGPIGQGGLTSSPSVGGPSQQATFGSSLGSTSGSSITGGSFGGNANQSGGSQSGTGLSGGSTGAPGEMSGQTQLGASSIGAGPFVGRSDTTGRFVGNSMAGQQSAFGAAFGQALQGLQGNRGGQNGRFGGQQQADERLPLRPTLRIGFEVPTLTPNMATERVAARMLNVAERRPQLAGVNITTDDVGRVVLRGSVATDDARQLAAAIVRLEPGVRDVVNELTVATSPTP